MELITYIRPSGRELTVNDTEETRALAKELGWVEAPEKKPEAKKKGAKS